MLLPQNHPVLSDPQSWRMQHLLHCLQSLQMPFLQMYCLAGLCPHQKDLQNDGCAKDKLYEKRKKMLHRIKSKYKVYKKFLTGLRFSFTEVERTKNILIGIFLTWFATKTTEEPTRPWVNKNVE